MTPVNSRGFCLRIGGKLHGFGVLFLLTFVATRGTIEKIKRSLSNNKELKMSEYTTEQIEAFKELGAEWQKAGMHRIYFNGLSEWYGLDCSYYNTGNISSARLDGETISNTAARKIQARLALGKVWFDVTEGKFYSKGLESGDFNAIIKAIKAKAREVVKEAVS